MDSAPMHLELDPECRQAIIAHAEQSYPEECCGTLLGVDREGVRRISKILPYHNSVADNRQRRFLIDPRAVLEAERQAAASGVDVLGIYHSHPDHPSQPSEFDREHAMPFWSYVIVAVAKGRFASLQSWRLRDDRTAFDEEPTA